MTRAPAPWHGTLSSSTTTVVAEQAQNRMPEWAVREMEPRSKLRRTVAGSYGGPWILLQQPRMVCTTDGMTKSGEIAQVSGGI